MLHRLAILYLCAGGWSSQAAPRRSYLPEEVVELREVMEAHLVDSSDEESDEGLQDRPEEASASDIEELLSTHCALYACALRPRMSKHSVCLYAHCSYQWGVQWECSTITLLSVLVGGRTPIAERTFGGMRNDLCWCHMQLEIM